MANFFNLGSGTEREWGWDESVTLLLNFDGTTQQRPDVCKHEKEIGG